MPDTDLVSLAQAKSRLGETSSRDDSEMQETLNRAVSVLSMWCRRPMDIIQRVERFHGNGSRVLVLPYPVGNSESPPVVEERLSAELDWTTVASSDYEIYTTYEPVSSAIQRTGAGRVWHAAHYPTVRVTWDTGYDALTVPREIQYAILDIFVALWRHRRGRTDTTDQDISQEMNPFVNEVVKQYQTVRPAETLSLDPFRYVGTDRRIGGYDNILPA